MKAHAVISWHALRNSGERTHGSLLFKGGQQLQLALPQGAARRGAQARGDAWTDWPGFAGLHPPPQVYKGHHSLTFLTARLPGRPPTLSISTFQLLLGEKP